MDTTEIIKGLEKCAAIHQGFVCENCEYPGCGCAIDDAVALLRAQEPRVMTLEEIHAIYRYREDHVWPFGTPPYLWVETNGRTAPYWMSWNNVIACLEGQFPKYDPDDYGKTWRCWTAKPSEEQRRETAWE